MLSGANNGKIGFAKRTTVKSKNALSTGAIIGIAVGGAAAVLLLAILTVFCIRRRRQRKAANPSNGKAEWDKELPSTPSTDMNSTGNGVSSNHSHPTQWMGNYAPQPMAWPQGSPTQQPLLAPQDSPSLYTPSTQSSFTPAARQSYISMGNGASPVLSSPNPPRSPHSPVSAHSGMSVHSPPPMYNTNPIRVVERLSRPPAPVHGQSGLSGYP